MSLSEWIVLGIFGAFLVALLRTNETLGGNRHQQLKAHEELSGPFPNGMSQVEKARLVNLYGLSPTNPNRTWFVALAVALGFVVLFYWQAS